MELLHSRGLLTEEARRVARAWLRPPELWGTWVSRLLLLLGTSLVLAGIIFFFAHNWERLGPLLKLGLIQGAMLACLLGAWLVRSSTLPCQVLLTAACVLVGVLLAVYGQIYQTGADAFELFLGWWVLILPWVLAVGNGMKIGKMAGMIAPYPTLGEVSKRAAGSYYMPKLFSERTRKIVRFLLRFA